MDSPPVLRQHSQNKIQSDYQRRKNENNTNPVEPNLSRGLSSLHISSKDDENKDPAKAIRKPPFQPGISRLPVLAKSLHVQAEFQQSHIKWEEKPFAGKTRKKKPCTRPIPFNFSEPKGRRMTIENHKLSTAQQSRTHNRAGICAMNAIPHQHRAVLTGNGKCMGKSKSGLSNTLKVCTDSSKPLNTHQTASMTKQGNSLKRLNDKGEDFQADHAALLSILGNEGVSIPSQMTVTPKQSKQYNYLPQRVSIMKNQQKAGPTTAPMRLVNFSPDSAALKSILKNEVETFGGPVATPRSTSRPPGRGTSIYTAQRQSVKKNPSGVSSDKEEHFQADNEALLSILRNEGVAPTAQVTSKQYNYVPQRVSIMKGLQKDGPNTALLRSVQFLPDSAALQSILQIEGVKCGGAASTPGNTVCPPGRATSIYTAQRVPVKKNSADATEETPLKKWSPQRVRNTRHQPMSATRWHQLTHMSPYTTPGNRSCKTNTQPQQKEVVQRLFADPEDEQSTDGIFKDCEIQSKIKTLPEGEKELFGTNSDDEDQEEQKGVILAQPRESVIFYSTGKKMFRAPRFKDQESLSPRDQPDSVSTEPKTSLTQNQTVVESEAHPQIIPAAQLLHRDLSARRPCLNPAVAMLRKRLPPLEELLLDEEVATYTSVSAPAAPGLSPPQPRCGNPVASILLFEESTRFIPVDFHLSCGPSPSLTSAQHER